MCNKTTLISKAHFFEATPFKHIFFTATFFLTFKNAELLEGIIFVRRIVMREEVMEAIVIGSESAELQV
jgi:flagellar biosynthesis regulator FlbT